MVSWRKTSPRPELSPRSVAKKGRVGREKGEHAVQNMTLVETVGSAGRARFFLRLRRLGGGGLKRKGMGKGARAISQEASEGQDKGLIRNVHRTTVRDETYASC